jgi:hypothetical protein
MNIRSWIASPLMLAALVVLAACESGAPAPAEITKIESTTSFGMCVGYCMTKLEIVEGEAVLTRDGRSGRDLAELPDQRFVAPLSDEDWSEFARLAAAAKLADLPVVIGCPDCADGGAESLTIIGAGGEKTIKFDFGADIKEAAPLLARVRALREKLLPKQ